MANYLGISQWRPEDIQRMKLERARQAEWAREQAEDAKRKAALAYRALRAAYHARAWK